MPQRLRIFVSSPSDVADERLRANLVIDKLSQDYSRFFSIESYQWEHEPMLASKHFQDAIDPPSAFDIVLLILWSRLGTPLPVQTATREYRGIDGRAPVTGTEWEYEEALKSARERGAPDLLAFRNINAAPVDPRDPDAQEKSYAQFRALNAFWSRHFADRGNFLAAYDEYISLEEFARRLEETLRKLIEKRVRLLTVARHVPDEAIWLREPFLGLESYEFQHSQIFFGRDAVITKAIERLAYSARSRVAFQIVVGASGAGKSSLVKAAIVPRLMKPQRISGIAFIRRIVFRPAAVDNDLILGFAKALTRGGDDQIGLPELLAPGQDASSLAEHLKLTAKEPAYLFESALGRVTEAARIDKRILSHENAKLILVVDQLEELFTVPGIKHDERLTFFQLMGGLARSGTVWVIATIRADFWQRVTEYPELFALCDGQRRIDVTAPSRAELDEIIRKPALVAGLAFEQNTETGVGLDSVIAEDAANAPGVLPHLSFTLAEIYADAMRRGETVLAFESYEALGRLEGAIANRANNVISNLPETARAEFPRVIRALVGVTTATDAVPTSRLVYLDLFPQGTSARILIDALIEARLLVANSDGVKPTVRLAHDALISRWPRAREQVSADRRMLETRSRVEQQLERWRVARGRSRSQLFLRNPDLENAIDLDRRWGSDLPVETRDFILRSKRRARLVQTGSIIASIVFAICAAAAILFAQQATSARNEAEVSLFIARSQQNLTSGNNISAINWAAKAFDRKQTHDTRSTVLAALMSVSPYLLKRVSTDQAAPDAAAWIDNRILAFSASDGALRLLDTSSSLGSSPDSVATISYPDGDGRTPAIICLKIIGPDLILAVLSDATFIAIRRDGGAFTTVSTPHKDLRVRAASVNSDGSIILIAPTNDTAQLYDCRSFLAGSADSCPRRELFANFATAVALSPQDDREAIGEDGGSVEVHYPDGRSIHHAFGQSEITSIAWHPYRNWIAVGADNGKLELFDVERESPIEGFPPANEFAGILSWSPTGDALAYACEKNKICVLLFNFMDGASPHFELLRFSGHANTIAHVAWSPDGKRLATADSEREYIIWSMDPDKRVAYDLVQSIDSKPVALAYSSKSNQLAAILDKGGVAVWDAPRFAPNDSSDATTESHYLKGMPGRPVALIWNSEGSLCVAYSSKTLAVWADGLDGKPTISKLPSAPSNIVLAPDGISLMMRSADGALYGIEISDRKSAGRSWLLQPPEPRASAVALAVNPRTNRLIVSYVDALRSLWDWDVLTKRVIGSLPMPGHGAPLSLSISPDARFVAAISGDPFVSLIDLDARKLSMTLSIDAEEAAKSVAFSPDGRLLASVGVDNKLYIWMIGSGSVDPFATVNVEPASFGSLQEQYATDMTWIGPNQIAILTANMAIRVINLDTARWWSRLSSLGLASGTRQGALVQAHPNR
jgi:WD40 repeat protein